MLSPPAGQDVLFDLLRSERFANVAARARGQSLYHMPFTALGGDHHHRNALGIFYTRQLLDELQTIHDRHVDVAENKVDLILLQDAQRFGAVAGFKDLRHINAGPEQGTLHDFAHDRGIVHDERAYVGHSAVFPGETVGWQQSCL